MSIVTFIAILLPNPTIDCCMIYMHHTAIMLTDIIIIEYEWSCPGRCRVLRHRKGQIQNRKLQVVIILTDTRSLVAMLQWQWWWWWWRSWGSACYCWSWGWLKIVVFVQVFSMFCSVVTMLQTSVSLRTIAIIAKFSDITLIAQSVGWDNHDSWCYWCMAADCVMQNIIHCSKTDTHFHPVIIFVENSEQPVRQGYCKSQQCISDPETHTSRDRLEYETFLSIFQVTNCWTAHVLAVAIWSHLRHPLMFHQHWRSLPRTIQTWLEHNHDPVSTRLRHRHQHYYWLQRQSWSGKN